jgi:myosin-18
VVHGDHLLAVNGQKVDSVPHNKVVELIRSSGESLSLVVASAPELAEISLRGGLDVISSFKQEAGKTVLEVKGATLRRTPAARFKAHAARVEEHSPESSERVWLVHAEGYSAATLMGGQKGIERLPSEDVSFGTDMRDERCKILLLPNRTMVEVDAGDIEKANPSSLDRVEDLTSIRYLNESSILHTLRQRLGNSLIHTYAGPHLLIMKPLRAMPIYSDKVAQVFRGCRREDMPPHIFAAAQSAYSNMLKTKSDQSLITMGISGSGKTFTARHLQKYLTLVATSGSGLSLGMKLDAAQQMLEAFGHAITNLNRSATRFTRVLSLYFDFAGMMTGASLQSSLVEKHRTVQRTVGEYTFNIFYYLLAGCSGKLRNELQLGVVYEQQSSFFSPLENQREIEWARKGWYNLASAIEHLGVSVEEARALWSLLAAIYHLGFAGAVKGAGAQDRGRFLDLSAAQRAASLLGVTQEELKHAIFSLPSGIRRTIYQGKTDSPSPPGTPSSSPSMQSFVLQAPSAEAALEAFAIGLFEQAFASLVSLINRAVHSSSHHATSIHIVDMPGFQNPNLSGRKYAASFDDLLHNYAQERLQMTFYNTVFVTEQDRYAQEKIDVNFTAVPQSPLSVISLIDQMGTQHTMRSGGDIRVSDSKGLLYILDEESIFPGATTNSFLERLQFHARSEDLLRGKPLVQVFPEHNSFVLSHCQKTLPVQYKAENWLRRAREHPATRAAITLVSEAVK